MACVRSRKRRRRGGKGRLRARRQPPRIRIVHGAEEAFRAAILAGVLSSERSDHHWAGHRLYLFHDEDGAAWFRHRDSGARLTMEPPPACGRWV